MNKREELRTTNVERQRDKQDNTGKIQSKIMLKERERQEKMMLIDKERQIREIWRNREKEKS